MNNIITEINDNPNTVSIREIDLYNFPPLEDVVPSFYDGGDSAKTVITKYTNDNVTTCYGIINMFLFDNTLQIVVIDAEGAKISQVRNSWKDNINNSYPIIRYESSNSDPSNLLKQQFSVYKGIIFFFNFWFNGQNQSFILNPAIKQYVFITNMVANNSTEDNIRYYTGVDAIQDDSTVVYFIGNSPTVQDRIIGDQISINKMLILYLILFYSSNNYPISVSYDYLSFIDALSEIYAIVMYNVCVKFSFFSDPVLLHNFEIISEDIFLDGRLNLPSYMDLVFDHSLEKERIELNMTYIDIFNLTRNQNMDIYRNNVHVILKSFYLYMFGSNGLKTTVKGTTFNIKSILKQLQGENAVYDDMSINANGFTYLANMLFMLNSFVNYNFILQKFFQIDVNNNTYLPFIATKFNIIGIYKMWFEALKNNINNTFIISTSNDSDILENVDILMSQIGNAIFYNAPNVLQIDIENDGFYVIDIRL